MTSVPITPTAPMAATIWPLLRRSLTSEATALVGPAEGRDCSNVWGLNGRTELPLSLVRMPAGEAQALRSEPHHVSLFK